jgi:hypothetical protein
MRYGFSAAGVTKIPVGIPHSLVSRTAEGAHIPGYTADGISNVPPAQ